MLKGIQIRLQWTMDIEKYFLESETARPNQSRRDLDILEALRNFVFLGIYFEN